MIQVNVVTLVSTSKTGEYSKNIHGCRATTAAVRRNTRIGEKIAPLSEASRSVGVANEKTESDQQRPSQDNMKDQAQLKYAVCMGVLVMLHPGGWIGECAATMLSYKGRRRLKFFCLAVLANQRCLEG